MHEHIALYCTVLYAWACVCVCVCVCVCASSYVPSGDGTCSGSVYLDDCEDRRTIPIWLIVFGCVSVVQSVIDICKRCFRKKKDDEEGQVRDNFFFYIKCLF